MVAKAALPTGLWLRLTQGSRELAGGTAVTRALSAKPRQLQQPQQPGGVLSPYRKAPVTFWSVKASGRRNRPKEQRPLGPVRVRFSHERLSRRLQPEPHRGTESRKCGSWRFHMHRCARTEAVTYLI